MKPGSQLSVLLVDNDQQARTSVCRRLRAEGLAVIEGKDADFAMALIGSGHVPVDVVVTDEGQGAERGGFFLAKWIRQHHPHVAVAVTSGSVGFFSAAAQLAEGAAFVEKPYDVDALIRFLHELVQERGYCISPWSA